MKKYMKWVLLALLEVLIVRELIGIYEWFEMDEKRMSDLKRMTSKEIKEELHDEVHHPVRHYGKIIKHTRRVG